MINQERREDGCVTEKFKDGIFQKTQLLEGPIGTTLIKLTIPLLFAMVSILLFNIVDTYFIGKLGVRELAAISYTFPVVFVVMSITFGLGIGTSAAISHAIGSSNYRRIRRLTTDGIILAALVVIVVVSVGIFTIDPIFQMMGATPDLLPLIHDYMNIWYLGVGFIMVPIVGNNAMRATGDTKTPSLVIIVIGVVNAILDPFLIFGIGPFPRMEVQGAALATVIAYSMAFFAALWFLGIRKKMLDFAIPQLVSVLRSWKQILHVGLPAAGTQLLIPLSTVIITRIIAGFGPEAVAAYGVGTRLEFLAMIGILAMSLALSPFVGQNWGAGQTDRVLEGVQFSLRFSLIWGGAVYLILAVAAFPIARFFSEDEKVIAITVQFFWIVPLGYGFHGMAMLVNSTYNALKKPFYSTVLIVVQFFILVIPLAFSGSLLWKVPGIFIGIALANIIIGLLAYGYARQFIHKATVSAMT